MSFIETEPTAATSVGLSLRGRPGMGVVSIELTVEPHVYLHDAELLQDFGAHARIAPQAYKDETSVVWRQIEPRADAPAIEFKVTWLAIANATPDIPYVATLTVRDARGRLVDAPDLGANPATLSRQIGPAGTPTDRGGVSVVVHREPD